MLRRALSNSRNAAAVQSGRSLALARSRKTGEMGELRQESVFFLSSGRLKQEASVTLTNWVEIAVLVIVVVLAVGFFQKRS